MSSRPKIYLRKPVKRDKVSLLSPTINEPLLSVPDYQAPLTSETLASNSKWLIVRHNIHKIRSWGAIRHMSNVDKASQDWYLFFQMRRELKRAEEQIRSIQHRPNFTPVRHFELPIDDKYVRRYNVSHVKPTDGLYYAGLGAEPIVLQSLLYYFSKDCPVPYNSMFYSFLSDVNSVLNTNRQRLNRVVVLQRIAFAFTLTFCIIILLMFFSLILSMMTTMTKFHQMYGETSNLSTTKSNFL